MFLEHVNLTVSQLDRSIEFYSKLFGFEVRWRGRTTTGVEAAHIGDERCYVALFQAERPNRAERDYAEVGLNHFGFVVEDLDAFKNRLQALGAAPHSEQDYEPGRRLYFLDPDGIEIELVEYDHAAA